MNNSIEEWFKSYKEISCFESNGKIPGNPWKFYLDLQEVIKEIPNSISPQSKISNSAEIGDFVFINEGVRIFPNAFIEGPSYIGKNVVIGNSALVRKGSFISHDSIIGNHCYCTASIIGPWSGAFHFSGISRSLIGKNSRLSAYVVTATTSADIKPVQINDDLEPFNKIGCTIGNNTFIAPHTLIGSGVSIGNNCFIGSFSNILNNVEDNTRIIPQFDYRVEKRAILTRQHPNPPDVNFKSK